MRKFYQKGKRRVIKATNAIDPATTNNKGWGFSPVPCKGGKTTNYVSADINKKEDQ